MSKVKKNQKDKRICSEKDPSQFLFPETTVINFCLFSRNSPCVCIFMSKILCVCDLLLLRTCWVSGIWEAHVFPVRHLCGGDAVGISPKQGRHMWTGKKWKSLAQLWGNWFRIIQDLPFPTTEELSPEGPGPRAQHSVESEFQFWFCHFAVTLSRSLFLDFFFCKMNVIKPASWRVCGNRKPLEHRLTHSGPQ